MGLKGRGMVTQSIKFVFLFFRKHVLKSTLSRWYAVSLLESVSPLFFAENFFNGNQSSTSKVTNRSRFLRDDPTVVTNSDQLQTIDW